MKRRTKLISLVLAVSMMMPSVMSAMAAEIPTDDIRQDAEVFSDEDVSENASPGLKAEYWTTKGRGTNVEYDQLKSNSIDYYIRYDDMNGILKEQTGQEDYAGVRWSGRIKAPTTGDYTFYANADNGFRMWIEDELLIDDWDGDTWNVLQTSKAVHLEAGKYYAFRADYFEFEQGSNIVLSWSNDQGMSQRAIPESAFYLPENFDGLYISGIDTSAGDLQEEEQGTVKVKGTGFSANTSFELLKGNGESLKDESPVTVKSVNTAEVELDIPPLKVGSYKIRAVDGNSNLISKSMLIVLPKAEEEPARTERPRADWERAENDFVNLNGWWDFSFDDSEKGQSEGWYEENAKLEQKINVPFCWESSLSGVGRTDYLGEAWYQRKVTVPDNWDERKIFLKFGAVDWKCKLWVNGTEVGEHTGGYNAFEFDVTEYVEPGQESTITLWVEDRGSYGDDSYPALIGKQGRNAPCGYIHTSGIWQTVGLEARSATYLDNARAAVDVDQSAVTYKLDITSDAAQELTVEYDFESKVYDIEQEQDVSTGSEMKGSQTIQVKAGANALDLQAVTIQNPKLWNYDDPNLYYGTLTVKNSNGAVLDTVKTYFGMRKVEQKYFDESLGVKYIYINDAPVYMSGLLDQGFWEDGIYTAPSEEALQYDILKMKEAGFNMVRKHLKVEDPLQYYWCDKLGMLVWQDMPHATAMVPDKAGDETPGRVFYEECLDAMMNMNYNHPSIVAVMLFNETWGLHSAYGTNGGEPKRDIVAKDGKSTGAWIEELFYRAKELNPNLLVEDMSACNFDHVQPTELYTYHMYPDSYDGTVSVVERMVNSAYPGSTEAFKFGYTQDGDPLLNSEYGGVGAGAGDFDVSYCFKYMTDIQRRYEKQSGFVYTEPYDVEYERNGIMTYDRNMKVFGYDEIAYGGDMSMKDLLQEIYVGIVDQPMQSINTGKKMKTTVMAIGWTNDLPETITLKWRFDGTDIYGNYISTGLSGEKTIRMEPYRKVSTNISYTAPSQACVGTLTVWLEDAQGNKIAKNFSNIAVNDDTAGNTAYTQKNQDGSVIMKAKVDDAKMASSKGADAQNYSYMLPDDFNVENLQGLRVLAEASSLKLSWGTDKNMSSFTSDWGQTAEGRERPSDLTVSVNGVELDTIYLPDNPRDMRGTLSLNNPYNGRTSAGDFGYLINLNVTDEKLQQIKEAIGADKKLTVTYQVKENAEHKNGFRIYSSEYGRYAVNPTLILNPADQKIASVEDQEQTVDVTGNNYSVEAVLEASEGYVVRNDDRGGYRVEISADGSKVVVVNAKTKEIIADSSLDGEAVHRIKATVFDERICVYVDNNPEPVINVYDKSGFTGAVTIDAGAEDVVVAPESYETTKKEDSEDEPQVTYIFEDDFSTDKLESDYQKMGNDLQADVTDSKLALSAGAGDKLIVREPQITDGTYEADINLIGGTGNIGLTFRSSNYQIGADGLDGYYAGIGDGFVQLGRMNNNWRELANVTSDALKAGTSHKLKIAVYGSRIQIYVDDVKYIDIVDDTYHKGGVAIRGFNCRASIDNIKITNMADYISDFENGVGEWHEDGNWENTDGVFRATGKSYALTNGSAWKNVTVAADLKAEDENALPALLLRVRETANGLNGYRAVLNVKENKIELVKSEQGEDEILKAGDCELETGKFYRMLAKAEGSRLEVYLVVDETEQKVISVENASFENGTVGLYSGQGISVFDNFSIKAEVVDEDVPEPVNTAALEAAIVFAESLAEWEEDYSKESYENMTKALEEAKAVSRDDQEAVNQATAKLQKALLELAKQSSGMDKDELQDALNKAEEAKKAAEDEKEKAEKRAEDAEKAKEEAEKRAEDAETAKADVEAEKKKAEEAAKQAQEALEAARNAAAAAEKAAEALRKELEQMKESGGSIENGEAFEDKNLKYKVTDEEGKTVSVTGSVKKNPTSLNIGATVKYSGTTYKITAVATNAFKNNKKLAKVTIGANITSIGSNAFYNNSKLKKVTVKSNVLQSVGKNAFKGIQKKAVIDVPNKKVKAYRKLFKKAGQPKQVKIK